jgi:hypothetical protein
MSLLYATSRLPLMRIPSLRVSPGRIRGNDGPLYQATGQKKALLICVCARNNQGRRSLASDRSPGHVNFHPKFGSKRTLNVRLDPNFVKEFSFLL